MYGSAILNKGVVYKFQVAYVVESAEFASIRLDVQPPWANDKLVFDSSLGVCASRPSSAPGSTPPPSPPDVPVADSSDEICRGWRLKNDTDSRRETHTHTTKAHIIESNVDKALHIINRRQRMASVPLRLSV